MTAGAEETTAAVEAAVGATTTAAPEVEMTAAGAADAAETTMDAAGAAMTAAAAAIPGASLDLVEGMGHDLPQGVWSRVIDGIVALASSAAPRAATRSPGR